MSNRTHSFESLVAESPSRAWLRSREGRFLAVSVSFAERLRVSSDDACRAQELDLFRSCEVERFRRDDTRVLATSRPQVFLEPPDSVSPRKWSATLKIPVRAERGRRIATLAFSHSLDLLEWLEELVTGAGFEARPAEEGATSRVLRAELDRLFRERLEVADLARLLNRHPDHLARCFRQSYGVTMAQYLRARKVAWAATRLARTDRPIAEIAVAAGFFDQSHLTRELKSLLKSTPAAYRKRARSGVGDPLLRERWALGLPRARDDRPVVGG